MLEEKERDAAPPSRIGIRRGGEGGGRRVGGEGMATKFQREREEGESGVAPLRLLSLLLPFPYSGS